MAVGDGRTARRSGGGCVVSVSAFERFPDGGCSRSLQTLAGGVCMGSLRSLRERIRGSANFTPEGIIHRSALGTVNIFRIPYRLCIIETGPMLPAARSRWER